MFYNLLHKNNNVISCDRTMQVSEDSVNSKLLKPRPRNQYLCFEVGLKCHHGKILRTYLRKSSQEILFNVKYITMLASSFLLFLYKEHGNTFPNFEIMKRSFYNFVKYIKIILDLMVYF